MNLPSSFIFSQSGLGAYAACPRRFQLRYVSEGAWPAVPCEPLPEQERRLDLGRRFHHLVRQHLSGISPEALRRSAEEEGLALRRWWRAYLDHPLPGLPNDRRTEVTLSVPMGAHRLQATYDLLALAGDRAVVVDWKTERRRPGREELLRRLQTRVYRHLLVRAGDALAGGPFAPEQVSMIYWFAEAPERPEVLAYDAAQHDEDGRYLSGLISEVETATVFPTTSDEGLCRHCVYRSLCDRGVTAGAEEEGEWEEAREADSGEGDEPADGTESG